MLMVSGQGFEKELSWTHQTVFCADGVNLLFENINTAKKKHGASPPC
jgi:hypothetical protein